ncbi:unnamed protein product [Spirodela intermedia]|uniref:Uncharacterized protein n=1 Tax=Spirodela intermedia TaxID=51605 RepID=A0A7I8LBR6_SPIIN|nr:unnamed protein product [Spirodela intermedia]
MGSMMAGTYLLIILLCSYSMLPLNSGIVSWDQVLRHAKLRKKYVSLYASLLKFSASWLLAHDNEDIKKLDRELDINVILQWR